MMDTDLNYTTVEACDLSEERIASSIPKADTDTKDCTWMYPSPRMFYNAMRRKGHTGAQTADMDVIVTIHNMVNEQTWQSILRWERYYHPAGEAKLKRFLGRPDSLSPKAWIRTYLLGYSRPFDRHDWYVERTDGSLARYVIDFYSGKTPVNDISREPLSLYIDARPALDTIPACYERMHFATNNFLNRVKDIIWNGFGL